MILAGVDSKGAHIYSIRNPGIKDCFDTIGFHAIGIGELHAVQVFIAHRYSTSCNTLEALNIVYAAKKAAEVAPGVGGATDIAIISRDGIKILEQTIITELNKLYDEVRVPLSQEIASKSARLAILLGGEPGAKEDASNVLQKKGKSSDTDGQKTKTAQKKSGREVKS
jgi:hypothetical protein